MINDGFHDLISVHIPEGSLLKPVRPAAVSCRTHFLGRTLDVIQALIGQRNDADPVLAGYSVSVSVVSEASDIGANLEELLQQIGKVDNLFGIESLGMYTRARTEETRVGCTIN